MMRGKWAPRSQALTPSPGHPFHQLQCSRKAGPLIQKLIFLVTVLSCMSFERFPALSDFQKLSDAIKTNLTPGLALNSVL